jgi:TonB-dependent SusC/RagA subfamily outer membrane receptor
MKTKTFFIILLSVFSLISLSGQKSSKKVTISGYVVDKYQFPVTNTSILIDDEKTDIVTDAKGYFKVKVRPSAVKIGIFTSFSEIKEETIAGRRRINFTLDAGIPQHVNIPNINADDELINVGYGSVKKKNLIIPVNKIDGTGMKYASYSTIYEMIRGQVPGVHVSGKNIKIQNASSFLLNTNPLFVVDGIMVETIDNIPPQLVSSIEVLKGAAASIYGSRGANGVLLITLKK